MASKKKVQLSPAQVQLVRDALGLRRNTIVEEVREAGENTPDGGVVFPPEMLRKFRDKRQAEADAEFTEIDAILEQLK